MKVVKIIKINSRGGNIEHFLVLLDEPYSNDDIEAEVEEWCESESSGQVFGYTYTWSYVEDIETITKVVNERLDSLNKQVNSFIAERDKLLNILI